MPSRRYHTKSYHICCLCKVKRVKVSECFWTFFHGPLCCHKLKKCGEQRLACSRCSTLNQECVYIDSNLTASLQQVASLRQTKAISMPPEFQDTILAVHRSIPASIYRRPTDEDNLRLQYHFVNSISTTFFWSSFEEDFETWVVGSMLCHMTFSTKACWPLLPPTLRLCS
jgi:hypothetical protein